MAEELKPGSESTSIKSENDFSVKGRPKTLDEIRTGSEAKRSKVVVKEKKKESSWGSLLLIALIALLLRVFLVEAFRIPTGSMKNTLLVGDYLFVNKAAYAFHSPKYIPFTTVEIPYFSVKTGSPERGDIIVFEYPGDKDVVVPREKKIDYIKRCIAISGDTIQIINKQAYVNGKIFQNPTGLRYREGPRPKGEKESETVTFGNDWNRDWYGPVRVPKKGDQITLNKENIGYWEVFIEREGHNVQIGSGGMIEVDGKPSSTYKIERDYLWMMGDNRDDSADSRYWGFMPVDNIVGEAMFIYWSWYNPPSGTGDGYDPEEVQKFHIRWDRIGNIIR